MSAAEALPFEEAQAKAWAPMHRTHVGDLRSCATRVQALIEATGAAVLYGFVVNAETMPTRQSALSDARTVLRLIEHLDYEVYSLQITLEKLGTAAGEALMSAEEADT